jgi:hypothetical protein
VFLRRVSYELLETRPKTASPMTVYSLWVSYVVVEMVPESMEARSCAMNAKHL